MNKKAGEEKKWMRSGTRQSAGLLSRIMVPMCVLALLQVFIFMVILNLNGGFSYAKNYSFTMLAEKTENRKNYVEMLLNEKTALVYQAAQEINVIAEQVCQKQGKKISELRTDKELNKELLAECMESLIFLVRRDKVNDAFLILDSGTLYNENGRELRSGLYMRDMDVDASSFTDNADIYMEMGASKEAREYGLALDFGWSLHLDVTDRDSGDFDFFYEPLATYEAHQGIPMYNLGYWSVFSSISKSQQGSLKYSLPLVAEDGTVYGVIGIGLLKKTIQQKLPVNDFFNDRACYVLAADEEADGEYVPVIHSGASYSRLVTEQTVLGPVRGAGNGLWDFSAPGGVQCVGSIQRMNLYGPGSPYLDRQWALISVADQEMLLEMHHTLWRTIVIAMVVTIIIGVCFALIVSQKLSLPVNQMVKELEKSGAGRHPVVFRSSGIEEIDQLAGAIVELQKAVMKGKDAEYTEKLLEANAALQAAYAAATRANDARMDVLLNMSRDIHMPMDEITRLIAQAQQNLQNPEKLAACLDEIASSGQYLISLINDVLDMSRIESGGFELEEDEIDLPVFAEELEGLIRPSADEKGQQLDFCVRGIEHRHVFGDRLRIQQIFMNIMGNAVKYTPQGGHLAFTLEEKPVGQSRAGCYILTFQDDGCGMEPECLKTIFEPAERPGGKCTDGRHGSGLGMALTRSMVRMMDGDIRVESEVGKGTTFVATIYLKFAPEDTGCDAALDSVPDQRACT